jgi:diguanylate cyclase (GGDEF)-like protein
VRQTHTAPALTNVMDDAVAEAVMECVDVAILACDAAGNVTLLNQVLRDFHGMDDGIPDVRPEDRAARYRMFAADGVTHLAVDELPSSRTLRDGVLDGLEIVVAPPGHPRRRLWCTGRAVHDSEGTRTGAVVVMRDITEERRTADLLREIALRDPLTGLPNRSAVIQALTTALAEVDGGPDSAALLFIDLDGFKSVNDRHGHAYGDALLVQAAGRLRSVTAAPELVGRLGGDEFVVLCPRLDADACRRPEEVAAHVVEQLSDPFVVERRRVRLSASVGIAFAEPGLDPLDLLARADDAMYAAKRSGRDRWCSYTARTAEEAQSASRIERLVRTALDDGTFTVHYQPLHDLRTGLVIGAEALARVPDGTGGWVPPDEFIPVAEDAGMVARLGEAVLDAATRQAVRWKEVLGEAEFAIGVNLSVRQLGDPHLLRKVSTLLDETGLPASALVMELTESIFSDDRQHEEDLAALRDLGVKIFIDDFGTGYSSLSYLRRFAVDGLKIDKAFVRDLVDDARDRRVTRAIVQMAFDLGIAVVAEGIETPAQHEVVRNGLGCVLGQGFLLSRPMPADGVTALVDAQAAG